MNRLDRRYDPGYGRVAVWRRGNLALCYRSDAQWGHLLVSYQWRHMTEAVVLRPGLEGRNRDMRRITKPEHSSLPIAEAEGGEWLEDWPNLTEFLTATRFDDPPGPRRPGSLTISTRFKLWTATLRCPNEGVQLRCDAVTPGQLLSALETFLVSPGCPWEPDPYWKGPSTGKKK